MEINKSIKRRIFSVIIVFCMIASIVPYNISQVFAAPVKAIKVKLNYSAYKIVIGRSLALKATVIPANVVNRALLWTTSDKKIVTVSNIGVITGVKKGKAIITVIVKGKSIKATCAVTVSPEVTKLSSSNSNKNGNNTNDNGQANSKNNGSVISTEGTAPDKEKLKEINDAIGSGIIPKELQENYSGYVTQKELYTLLSNCLKKKRGDDASSFINDYKDMNSGDKVTRQDAAKLIFAAAYSIDIVRPNGKTSMSVVSWLSGKDIDFKDAQTFEVGAYDAINFVTSQSERYRGRKVMDLTDDFQFRPNINMSRSDAIISIYRFYNSIDDKPIYVNVDDVGKNTIPQELLSKPTSLPQATAQKLPQWKGSSTFAMAMSKYSFAACTDKYIHEDEIKFLSEHGFNAYRIFLSFSELGGPDYDKPDMVNEVILHQLDDVIGWGIKYNVHIMIAMEGFPGKANAPWPEEITSTSFWNDTAEQDFVKRYWAMFARRYAGISNNVLSFNLMNEPDVNEDSTYIRVMTPIVEAIRREDPNRLLISDGIAGGGVPSEGIAKLGVALSYHFYEPHRVTLFGEGDFKSSENSDGGSIIPAPRWPVMYLPNLLYGIDNTENDYAKPITIEGNFSQGQVSIYVDSIYKNSELDITANGQNILKQSFSGGNDWSQISKKYVAQIPDGTRKIEISAGSNIIRFNYIQIQQAGKEVISIVPHTIGDSTQNEVAPKILVNPDGSFVNNDNPKKVLNWDYFYNKDFLPWIECAKRNNVGFVVGELGVENSVPENDMLTYLDMLIDGLNQCGIGYLGSPANSTLGFINSYRSDIKYEQVPGYDFLIDKDLLDFYDKHK